MEDVAKKMLSVSFADEQRWKATKQRLKAEGSDVPEDITYQQMVDFIEKDQFRVELNQNEHVMTMLQSAGLIVDLLQRRNWAVVIAQGAEFVCSDNPVGLMWIKSDGLIHAPGFGMSNTEVRVPISKQVALIGTFEPIATKVGTIGELGVGSFNNSAIARASRFIYSASDDFKWRPDTGEVANKGEYFTRFPILSA